MAPPPDHQHILILGAGVIGLTTSLVLAHTNPNAKITLIAKHFPGDCSIDYTSPWAGANWCSMANDNGPLEQYDAVTFHRFGQLIDGKSVFGCQTLRAGETKNSSDGSNAGNEIGLGRMGMWGVFDAPIGETGILTEATGKVWYDELVGGLRELGEGNTDIRERRLQQQAITKGITLIRRHYPSLSSLLTDNPTTTFLVNCTGLGSLTLSDIHDTNLYPTRGQTLLVAEPKTPISRMYFRSPARIDPSTTYVFPRPLGGGVILGGSRQDGDWSADWDEELGQDIMRRCCELCPELGRPEDLQVIGRNVGLRPTRKGGVRIETEVGKWAVPVVHCYGHAGAGYQSSWGTAERVLELVQNILAPSSRL
ncbi:d-amino acid [Stemphylium lycopersici]|nr:d-amino acid [Stemphylium lycopersici]